MFNLIRCTECGRHSLREIKDYSKYVFKCFYCSKTKKAKSSKTPGLNLNVVYCSSNFKEAHAVCKKYKEYYGG